MTISWFQKFTTVVSLFIVAACTHRNFDSPTALRSISFEGKNGTEQVDLTTYIVPNAEKAQMYQQMKDEVDAIKKQMPALSSYSDILADVQTRLKNYPNYDDPRYPIDEFVAIRVYTSNAYKLINPALRSQNPADRTPFTATIKSAASGLNRMRKYTGGGVPLTRCSKLSPGFLAKLEGDLQNYQEKKTTAKPIYSDAAFLSSTFGENALLVNPEAVSYFEGKIKFIIHVTRGAPNVSWLSEYPKEKEVIFPPGTAFEVLKISDEANYKPVTVKNVQVGGECGPVSARVPATRVIEMVQTQSL